MRHIGKNGSLFAQRHEAVALINFLYRAHDVNGGNLAMLAYLRFPEISGFVTQDFLGFRIDKRITPAENLPLIALILGDSANKGPVSGS